MPAGRDRICARCKAVLPWNDTFCDRCGQPLAARSAVPCADCQRRPPAYSRARAPLRYEFPVDVALKKLKYRGHTLYAPAFAELMLPLLAGDFADCDALVPVPLHRWRQARRGFNQAAEICRTLARSSGLPLYDDAIRCRQTASQSGLSAAERRRNLQGAFSAGRRFASLRPLVVDDVITTGATCTQLAKALLGAGAEEVGVLAVAHATRP
jgi:ComF family protein